jgi:hypothetical protein
MLGTLWREVNAMPGVSYEPGKSVPVPDRSVGKSTSRYTVRDRRALLCVERASASAGAGETRVRAGGGCRSWAEIARRDGLGSGQGA